MTTTDWIIDIALILVVLRQLREERIGIHTLLLPLGLIGWAAMTYLHAIPTAGNDLVLIGAFVAAGITVGACGGLLTRVRYAGGRAYVKATAAAASLWVISMGLRMAFAVWSSYHSGAVHVASFSAAHDITTAQAWVTALIFFAFGEVIVRLGIIMVRAQLLKARGRRADAAGVAVAPAVRVARTRTYA